MIKIDAWSDINCPFCYIGKRHLEEALKDFKDDTVEVVWKSFELDPAADPPKGAKQEELLAIKYGRDIKWAREMNANMTNMARNTGLEFHLEKLIPANSFHAHRLLHLAKRHGKQNEMKESLLRANFIEGKNIGSKDELFKLAKDIALPEDDVKQMLDSDEYAQDVRQDEQRAARLGINGVPFFLIDEQYPLSGAHPPEAFRQVLNDVMMSKR